MPIPDLDKALALFMSDPATFITTVVAVGVTCGGGAWWLRGHLGKERIATLEERLRLAADKQMIVNVGIERLGDQISQISQQIEGRTITVASLANETRKLSGTIGDLSLATSVVSGTLGISGVGGRYGISGKPADLKVTKKSEE